MTTGNPSHWRKKQEQSIWMKRVQFYICGDGKAKKRWIVVRDFCNFSCCPGEVRCRRIRGIRTEEKESSLLTLHCISVFVIIQVSFLFWGRGGRGGGGGRGSFLLGRNFGVLSQIMKEGNFASATSIAAGVWFSYSKQRHCKNVLRLRTSNQFELRLYGVTHTISRSFKTQLNTHVYWIA